MRFSFNYWKWMAGLLAFHLIVPNYYCYGSFPYCPSGWGLSWIAFGWDTYWLTGSTWSLTLQYAFQSFNAFLFYGLETIIPLMLLGLMFFDRKVHSECRALVCLVLSFALSVVYLYGRYLAWPSPFPVDMVSIPTHTVSIILFTVLAYKNWSEVNCNF